MARLTDHAAAARARYEAAANAELEQATAAALVALGVRPIKAAQAATVAVALIRGGT